MKIFNAKWTTGYKISFIDEDLIIKDVGACLEETVSCETIINSIICTIEYVNREQDFEKDPLFVDGIGRFTFSEISDSSAVRIDRFVNSLNSGIIIVDRLTYLPYEVDTNPIGFFDIEEIDTNKEK